MPTSSYTHRTRTYAAPCTVNLFFRSFKHGNTLFWYKYLGSSTNLFLYFQESGKWRIEIRYWKLMFLSSKILVGNLKTFLFLHVNCKPREFHPFILKHSPVLKSAKVCIHSSFRMICLFVCSGPWACWSSNGLCPESSATGMG